MTFRELFNSYDVSVVSLSNETGVSRTQIYSLLDARVNPNMMRYGSLFKLGRFFDMSIVDMHDLIASDYVRKCSQIDDNFGSLLNDLVQADED